MGVLKGITESNKKIQMLIKEKLVHYPAIVTQYFEWLIDSEKKMRTIQVYIKEIIHFIDFKFNGLIPDRFYLQINESDIKSYFESLDVNEDFGEGEVSNSYKATIWSALNSFYKYLIPEYITKNPVESIPRPLVRKDKKSEFLTIDEVKTLLNNVVKQNRERLCNRDLCIMMLGFYCGLRTSSIIQANISDIYWDENRMRVYESRTKYYDVPLSTSVKEQLKLWLADRKQILGSGSETDALFISTWKQRISDDAILGLLKNYSVDIGKVVNARMMRNTCIVNLYLQTKDLSVCAKLLNQTNIASVYRYIENLIPSSSTENAVQVLDNLYSFSPSKAEFNDEGGEIPPVSPLPILDEERMELIRSLKLEDLDLSVRTYCCLNRTHIYTVADILELSSTDVLKIQNISKRVVDELVEKLQSFRIPDHQTVLNQLLIARRLM